MCKTPGCVDHLISSKLNSNQANYQKTLIKDDNNNNNNLHSPLLPKTQTPKTSQQLLPQDDHIIIHTTTNNNPQITNDLSICSSFREAKAISHIALPMILTGLLLYSRSMISMIFLGRLGELALAGGSLALGFANITGYSVLSGLAMGMEPICGQAFGAQRHSLLGLTLHRTVLLLVLTSVPISLLWLNMERILLLCGQDHAIASEAQSYMVYSLPDLLAQSILYPTRIYLRSQSITLPLTFTAALAIALHLPLNWLMVIKLKMGIKGVALSGVITNFNILIFLLLYILFSKSCKKGLVGISKESLKIHNGVLQLAIPSCISVCLEWWWYEIMILLCGLLINPKSTVSSMGILIQTTSLIYIFPSSLSVSVSTRVSNELGAGRPNRAKRAAVTGLLLGFLLGLLALFFTSIVRGKWGAIFTKDGDIIKLTTSVLPIIGLCEVGNCPQTTVCGVLRGTARPKIGANINLGCFYLVGMPVALWLGFVAGFDFQGLWLGLLAAQGSCVVAMVVVLNLTNWEFQARRAKDLTHHNSSPQEEEQEEEDKQIVKAHGSSLV